VNVLSARLARSLARWLHVFFFLPSLVLISPFAILFCETLLLLLLLLLF
jgi:hypothetical protein